MFSYSIGALIGAAALVAADGYSYSRSYGGSNSFVNQTTCNGKTYTYQELAGFGFVPSDSRDKFGDTAGGFGSSIYVDKSQWKKLSDGSYSGLLWGLPDRGW